MKKLGFGLMRLPITEEGNPKSIDQELVNKMVDYYLLKGFTYFDTGYPYHQGMSEVAARRAVVERYPRESFTIADKMPTWMVTKNEDYQRFFDEQLERCGVEYFDYYLLHNLGIKSYEDTLQYGGFEQVLDNISYMQDMVSLNDEEKEIVGRATGIINRSIAIPCTACQYCVDDCPQNIPIPKYFSLYNDQNRFRFMPAHTVYYMNLAQHFGKSSDCIGCKQCEQHCPQHIAIVEELKKVAEIFDK